MANNARGPQQSKSIRSHGWLAHSILMMTALVSLAWHSRSAGLDAGGPGQGLRRLHHLKSKLIAARVMESMRSTKTSRVQLRYSMLSNANIEREDIVAGIYHEPVMVEIVNRFPPSFELLSYGMGGRAGGVGRYSDIRTDMQTFEVSFWHFVSIDLLSVAASVLMSLAAPWLPITAYRMMSESPSLSERRLHRPIWTASRGALVYTAAALLVFALAWTVVGSCMDLVSREA